jgi:hypothetical protein
MQANGSNPMTSNTGDMQPTSSILRFTIFRTIVSLSLTNFIVRCSLIQRSGKERLDLLLLHIVDTRSQRLRPLLSQFTTFATGLSISSSFSPTQRRKLLKSCETLDLKYLQILSWLMITESGFLLRNLAKRNLESIAVVIHAYSRAMARARKFEVLETINIDQAKSSVTILSTPKKSITKPLEKNTKTGTKK